MHDAASRAIVIASASDPERSPGLAGLVPPSLTPLWSFLLFRKLNVALNTCRL